MTQRWTHCRSKFLLIVLIWLTGSLAPSLADTTRPGSSSGLWVVSSSDNPFFRRSIDRLKQRLSGKAARLTSLLLKEVEQDPQQLAQADLIITLGARAMRQVTALNLDRPILHAYLTRYQYLTDPPLPGSHSLLLDQPLTRYVRFTRLLTGVQRIGLLNLKTTAFGTRQIHQVSRQETVDVIQKTLNPEHTNPVAAVRHILQKTDALLAIPAPDIYNRKTLKGILLAAYRLRKPVISYSPAHVRAGALGALYATPEQIGDQIADLALPWLQGSPPAEPFSLAQYFAIQVNQRVATALGIETPDKFELKQAIESGNDP